MAITFNSQPPDMCPAGNPMSYVFTSNQTTQANFSYIVEVYVDNVLIAKSRVFPVANGRGQIDTHDIVQRSLPVSFVSTVSTYGHLITGTTFITVYESYGATPTLHASASSLTRTAINATLSYRDWKNTNLITKFKDKLFFSDNPTRTWLVHKDKDYGLCMLTSDEYIVESVLYNASGVLIEIFSEQMGDETPVIGIDPYLFPFENIDDGAMMLVSINQSESARFKFAGKCDFPITVSWVNKYGCIESYAFTHYMENETKIETFSYERGMGTWSGASYIYEESISGVLDYAKVMTDSGTIYTGNMTDEMANWLQRELKESPAVFFGYGYQDMQRVNVRDVTYGQMNSRFDSDLPMVALKFEHTNRRRSINL